MYEKYADLCFIVSMRYLNNKELAEEMVMNAFLKAHNNIHNFENKHEGSLKAWIKRIAINECLMQLRKKNIFNDSFEDSIGYQADDTAFPTMHYKDILRLINEIPEHLKTVFNLYEIEGYKHNEIAEILSVSVGTSKSSLSRAKALLREKLIINGY
jgi:RNA polymerase sigma factor (sigma-70 family)